MLMQEGEAGVEKQPRRGNILGSCAGVAESG